MRVGPSGTGVPSVRIVRQHTGETGETPVPLPSSEELLRVLGEIAEHGAQHISFDWQIFSGCRGVNRAP